MKHSGFTLAELLIALALLGVIAAFTIPKVLQASAEQERVAKLRETAATLESAWYGARAANQVFTSNAGPNNELYDTLAPSLNTIESVRSAPAFTTIPGHPCNGWGYVRLSNGVVITGLANGGWTANALLVPQQTTSALLCIDINGESSPNLLGQDAFFATFNPWGDFDTWQAAQYTFSANGKSFLWGNATDDLYRSDGINVTVLAIPGYSPQARVGTWLTR